MVLTGVFILISSSQFNAWFMVTVKPLFMEEGERREELFLKLATSDCLFKNLSALSQCRLCVCSMCMIIMILTDLLSFIEI